MEGSCESNERNNSGDFVKDEEGCYARSWCRKEGRSVRVQEGREAGLQAREAGVEARVFGGIETRSWVGEVKCGAARLSEELAENRHHIALLCCVGGLDHICCGCYEVWKFKW